MRRSNAERQRQPPTWRVRVAAHGVLPRYNVPALKATLPAGDEAHARLEGVREAHRRADPQVPPWRPFIRASWPHARAKEVVRLI
jgi:hypothetical protein